MCTVAWPGSHLWKGAKKGVARRRKGKKGVARMKEPKGCRAWRVTTMIIIIIIIYLFTGGREIVNIHK